MELPDDTIINALCSGFENDQLIVVTNKNIMLRTQGFGGMFSSSQIFHYNSDRFYFINASSATAIKNKRLLAIGYTNGKIEIYLFDTSNKINVVRSLFFNKSIDTMCFNQEGNFLAVGCKNDLCIVYNYSNVENLFLNIIIKLWLGVKKQIAAAKQIDEIGRQPLFPEEKCNAVMNVVFEDIIKLFLLDKKELYSAWQTWPFEIQWHIKNKIIRIMQLYQLLDNSETITKSTLCGLLS